MQFGNSYILFVVVCITLCSVNTSSSMYGKHCRVKLLKHWSTSAVKHGQMVEVVVCPQLTQLSARSYPKICDTLSRAFDKAAV